MTINQPKILLLQGPLGPFFADLADALGRDGAYVYRICFNKGDRHFAKADHVSCYSKSADEWPLWIERYLARHDIDAVCCYGDCRFYHRKAKAVCDKLGVRFFACEEGYVRPGFVTLEEGGNNANSPFPERFRDDDLKARSAPLPAEISGVFRFQFWFATMYYIVKDWKLWGFGRYHHHRHGNWATEMMAWIIAGVRKNVITRWRESGLTERLVKTHAGNLFFVPLQVAVDTQMKYHSSFASVEEFIETTLRSFARNAPQTAHLVIKHHPMDRGFNHYGRLISRIVRKLDCVSRVTYAFDVDLDRILDASAGCATVNSTVGLQALERGVPTLTLGKSMIRSAGLTAAVGLDQFWRAPGEVNKQNVQNFKRALVAQTQQPGSFYRYRHVAASACSREILSTPPSHGRLRAE